jgi:hypothetical protein
MDINWQVKGFMKLFKRQEAIGKRSFMQVHVVKKPCAFRLQIESPLGTLRNLSAFFEQYAVIIEKMQMLRYRNGSAMLIIHCLVDKEIIKEIESLLSSVTGVMKMEKI